MIRGGTVEAGTAGAIVVTGASTGIGAAVCDGLIDRGYRVFGTVRATAAGRELERRGGTAVVMDVTDRDSVWRAGAEIEAGLGGRPLVGLVNNAGIAAAGPVEQIDLDDMRAVFEVNVLGAVSVTQRFLPSLRSSRGRIVMMSSISGRLVSPFMGPYAASKFALEAVSDSLRRELAGQGVRVVVIQPGPIATPIWRKGRQNASARAVSAVYTAELAEFARLVEQAEASALHPARVVSAVARAFSARRPPPRIVVARQAPLIRLLSLLPDRLVDAWVARRMRGAR